MLSRIILSMTFCGMASQNLMASTYTSLHKTTVLALGESEDPWTLNRGHYTTRVNNQPIFGFVSIHSVEIKAGLFTYQGTFQDRSYGPQAEAVCSGRIIIKRIPDAGLASPYAMRVTWLPDASSCQYTNQKTTLTLREALPIASSEGEFLPTNANTLRSETNGDVTWIAWKVVSSDAELNCRSKDLSTVAHVYFKDDIILAETRGGNAFTNVESKSWMLTRKGCYVRANNLYIAPLSIPEQYLPGNS